VKFNTAVRAIIGLELRSLSRDVRTVIMSIVLPVVLMPVLLLLSNRMEEKRVEREQTRTYRYAVVGTDAAFANALLKELPGVEEPDSVGIRFQLVETEDPLQALEDADLEFYIEGVTPTEWRAELEADTTRADELEGFNDTPVLRVSYRSNRAISNGGAREVRDRLIETRRVRRDSLIEAAGFPIDPALVAAVDTANVVSIEEVQGAQMGRFLTMFLVLLMLAGGSVLAVDTLAGAKERGTLVTLLTTAATRTEIVTAKLLAVVAVALVIEVVQVLNLWVYLGLGLIPVTSSFAVPITPQLAVGLLVLYLPVVLLTASVLLLTSAYARSYKEAQLLLTPVVIGLIVPTLVPFMPSVELTSAIVVVPLANLSIAVRDVLIGQPNWIAVGVAWLVTAGVAAWVTSLSVKALHNEALITGDTTKAEFLGGPALYRQRVLRVFLVFWAVKVIIDFNQPFEDLRFLVLFTVGVVFLVFPLLVIQHFKLDPVEALALRMPRPGVWVGVLLGAPAALISLTLVAQLMNYVIPVPQEMLENFGQALVPEDIPLWQVIFMLSVVPGIVEELTFRGVLVHGLRKRFGPVGIALVGGMVFGFFHFQLFRIPGTAVLGVLLTGIVLTTGSIYPAMLWHAISNGLAIYLGASDIDITVDSWPVGLGAVLALGLSFWVIWTNRTPLPDVGPVGPGRVSPPDRRSPAERSP
jgi:sodium transport system permease protein